MSVGAKDILIRELKDSLNEQRELNKTLQSALNISNIQVQELTVQVKLLNEQIDYMKRKLFVSSREKMEQQTDGQLSFNLSDEVDETIEELPAAEEEIAVKKHTRKKKVTFAEKTKNLPVEIREITLPEEEQICPICGTHLEVIGKETVRKELEYIPATLKVVEYVSVHYGCPKCKTDEEKPNIIHAPVPPALLRSYASPSIVAWVIYSKYVNGMPLYRQEKDWLQYGFELSRATMANWVIECTDKYLRVLYEFYHRLLLSREFAMADESPIQVLKEEGREATAKSYMWLFRSGEDDTPPIVLYKYASTRSGDVAKEFLKGFNGYLMADGYTGYNKVQDIKRCCCFAHIRRYFFDAIPKGKNRDISCPAVQGVEYCDKLFAYERHFKEKGYSYKQIKNGRLKKEKPVIEAFLSWLEKQKPIKGSKFATAVTYALNRKEHMMTYLEDGRCSLSNNLSEQKMKSYVIGRKGWLFSDSPEGAEASAISYSIAETALENGLNVYKYITYVLEKRPTEEMADSELEKLLPWNDKVFEMCKIER